MFARQQRRLCQRIVRRHRCRDRHRVETIVGEQLLDVRAAADPRMLPPDGCEAIAVVVAQPGELGSRRGVEVPDEIRSPISETYHAYGNHRPLHATASLTASPSRL